MKHLLLICFLLIGFEPVMAQNGEPPAVEEPAPRKMVDKKTRTPATKSEIIQKDSVVVEPGFLNVIVNSEVDALVRKNRYIQQNKRSVPGWRIQVIQATDKTKVLTMRSEVSNAFPQYETYLDYIQPYFKLRIGNFTERFEAYRAYKEVRDEFSRAFLVREKIPVTKIRNW